MTRAAVLSLSYNTLGLIQTSYPRMRMSFDGPIYITDNGSRDGSADWLRTEMDDPDGQTYVTCEPENLGYTAGCNRLIERAQSDYDPDWFILANSDLIVPVEEDWVDALLAPFEEGRRSDAYVVGCRLMMDTLVIHGGGTRSPGWRLRFCWQVDDAEEYDIIDTAVVAPTRYVHRIGFRDDWTTLEQVPWVTFACAAIRKEAVEELGLLDERFFLYSSDLEYCLRVGEAGKQIWYNGLVTLEHLHEKSVEEADNETLELGVADLICFYEECERPEAFQAGARPSDAKLDNGLVCPRSP